MNNYELITPIYQVSKKAFLDCNTLPSYQELALFKRQLTQDKSCIKSIPYSLHKRQAWVYKYIFFSFALFFAFLGLLIYFKTGVWSWNFSVNLVSSAKKLICILTTLLSLASLYIGITLNIEKDALLYCLRKSKRLLKEIYWRKQTKFGFRRFLGFGIHYHQNILLKQFYLETSAKINQSYEEALNLLSRIRTSSLSKEQAEVLLNQMMAEFNDKLHLLHHIFDKGA